MPHGQRFDESMSCGEICPGAEEKPGLVAQKVRDPQNAADGENYGLEAQGSYRLGTNWQFSGSAALLHTRYLGVGGVFTSLDIDGRAQPFAPGYEASAAIEYHLPSGWFARLDSHAIDNFYYYTLPVDSRHAGMSYLRAAQRASRSQRYPTRSRRSP